MAKFVRFLIPIVIAVVLGPLIAGLAVWIWAFVLHFFNPYGSFADLLPFLYVYVLFAYFLGGWIALLAGIMVSIWMLSRPPSLIVVVAAAIVATAVYLGTSALGLLGPVEAVNAPANFPMIFSLAVIAAIGCWLVMRRFAPAQ